MSINATEYFLLIRRQRRPCLLAIVDGLSLAGQHAGRRQTGAERMRRGAGRCEMRRIRLQCDWAGLGVVVDGWEAMMDAIAARSFSIDCFSHVVVAIDIVTMLSEY